MTLVRHTLHYFTLVLLGLWASDLRAASLGTVITYQGQLVVNGQPANGIYDLRFALWSRPTIGLPVSPVLTNAATGVTNGLFSVVLDFGADSFDGTAHWLEVGARTNGGGEFTTLAPRQRLTAAPAALYAANAGTAASANSVGAANIIGPLSLSQLPEGVVTNSQSGVNLVGAFSGSGTGLTNLPGSISNCVYLSVHGDDETAVVGDASLPAASLAWAMALAQAADPMNAIVWALPDGVHRMTDGPTVSNSCRVTLYAWGARLTNAANDIYGTIRTASNSVLRIFGGEFSGDPYLIYTDEPDLVQIENATLYSPTGTPIWYDISPRNAQKLVLRNCDLYGTKHLIQADAPGFPPYTNHAGWIVGSRLLVTNATAPYQAGMVWWVSGTLNVENSYLLSSGINVSKPAIWIGNWAWLNIRNSTVETLMNDQPAATNIALGYLTTAHIYGQPCEPDTIKAVNSLASVQFHPTKYLGTFTGNGAGLDISATTQSNLRLAGNTVLLRQNVPPSAQALGANNGSLWVSNAVLYFTFTTDGTNATSTKIAGP